MKTTILSTVRNAAIALALTAAAVTSASAQSAEMRGIMGMVNGSLSKGYRAANPNTSMAEVDQIRRHYSGWANRMGGSVAELESRNRLGQRYHYERDYRTRVQAQQDASDAQTYADGVLRWLGRQ